MASRALLTASLWFFLSGIGLARAQYFTGFGQDIDLYIRAAASQYNVSEPMLRGLVKMESGWSGKISPTGATGVGQFTMGTWNWLARTEQGQSIGMQLITPANRGTSADPRHNKYINTLATGLYTRWHIERFRERGIRPTDANLYMAHNIGLDGLHRALLGKSTVKDIINMRRNGMKRWMSVQDFIHYQQARYLHHQSVANSSPLLTLTRKLADKADNLIWLSPISRKYSPSNTGISSNSPAITKDNTLAINSIEKDITRLKPVAIETFTVKAIEYVENTPTSTLKPTAIAKSQRYPSSKSQVVQTQEIIWDTEPQMIWVAPQ